MNDQAKEIEAACSPEGGCGSDELYALMVLGDDMLPEFEDGDVIVIDPSGQASDGKYIVAEHNGEYTFRQLAIEDNRFFIHTMQQPNIREELVNGAADIKGLIVQKTAKNRRERKKYY
ncbi:MAG: S24 family peptidase [Gammaproteobacteria bacterium]|nr:S24 family peptidase [Gammaproteobacteria bacterium]